MSHTTHWAFDRGIFTISDQYEVLVHPKAKRADHKDFEIFGLAGKKIILPDDESRLPHPDALLWHKEEVFGCFQR